MSLPKIEQSEIDTTTHWTVADAVLESGRDKTFVSKAIATVNVEPVATVKTGKPGRPPKLFLRTDVEVALAKATEEEQIAATASAIQTDVEENTTKQVA